MDIQELMRGAKAKGNGSLTEAESKQVLKHYGVPVVHESIAVTLDEAVTRAREIGFPVVLKGLGVRLTHKTERGLVRLNLKNAREVRSAAGAVAKAAGSDLEGYLIQPMVKGRREFVAGLFCDPFFGPVIMFGLGGIFTEALEDVVFRIAPLCEKQAESMIDELRASRLMGTFRGEGAVLRDEIVKVIMGLSRLSTELEDVTEVDINPLVIDAEGRVTAVDALVVIGSRQRAAKGRRKTVAPEDIGRMFNPKSVAFVGASAHLGKWGNLMFTHVLAGGYEGAVHLVNPKGGTIISRPVYRSVTDIPGAVDLAVVTLPAPAVLDLIPEFKAKGIRYMLLISSGFSETGPEGKELEDRLVKAAEEAGILIIGPNTMGICTPNAKFCCTGSPCWPKNGSIGLVSQSGNLGIQLLTFAEMEGLGIRFFCGSGNEAMISVEDYLHAVGASEHVKTVLLYIESIKDGGRFFSTATKVSRKKPVIALKGGRTEAGSRAAASHTGAMASNIRIFNVACRQAGVVLADQPMDLLDLSAAFTYLPLPKGKRLALMTFGGGWGVVATDLCIESGLAIPRLTKDVIARIDEILPPYWSHENPIDLVGEVNPDIPMKVVEALAEWDGCDAIIHLGIVGKGHMLGSSFRAAIDVDPSIPKEYYGESMRAFQEIERAFCEHTVRLMERHGKPIVGVSLFSGEKSKTVMEFPESRYQSVIFSTPERAVKAVAQMSVYSNWLRKQESRS